MVGGVDSGLLQEWQSLVNPDSASPASAPPAHRAPSVDPRAFRARVRAEMHQLVRDLSAGRYEEAIRRVRQVPGDEWDAARLEAALEPFLADHARILFDPPARQAHWPRIVERAPRLFEIHQVLPDDQGHNPRRTDGLSDPLDELPPDLPPVTLPRLTP
mgnify:CR=1 FL=1